MPDGATIESVNPAFAAMHGWTVEELRGKPMADLSPPIRRDEFRRMDPAFGDRGHQIWETERLRRNGMVFPALIDATAVKDADGQVIYYAVNVQDLTERTAGWRSRCARRRRWKRWAGWPGAWPTTSTT